MDDLAKCGIDAGRCAIGEIVEEGAIPQMDHGVDPCRVATQLTEGRAVEPRAIDENPAGRRSIPAEE